MIEINSPQNPRIKRAAKLRTARGRKQQQRILIEGARELLRAAESNVALEEVYFDESAPSDETIAALLDLLPDTVERLRIARNVWDKLAVRGQDAKLLGIAATPSLELSRLELPASPLVLVLESVEKPGNLGALLRTADAAGVDAVIVSDPVCDVHNPNVIRASLGAVFSLRLAVAEGSQVARFLADRGIRVLSTQVEGALDFWDADFCPPTAVVVGSEADGVSALWKGSGSQAIRLPMNGRVDSLNVSAAAAAVLYEALRQRR